MTEPSQAEQPVAQRILIVDDDSDVRSMLALRLKREGFTVFAAGSKPEALEIARQEGMPDLAILDIMMPDADGFSVAEELQALAPVPVIFLSAVTDTERKVEGISLYAEDYVTKPYVFSELLARIRRVLTRSSTETHADPEQVIDERLRINFAQQYAIVDDNQLVLTPTETRLLQALFANRGRVLSPGYLLSKAWDPTHTGTVESLWVHIRRLRSKIEPDPDQPRYLVTVRGQGYCLPQQVRPAD
jgi:DNA-binding response OmpR family regulator